MSFDQWRMVVVAALTAVTSCSLMGVIAVWGATGSAHWFFRTSVVLLFAASWLFVGDDGLCLMFLTQSAVVTYKLRSAGQRHTRAPDAAVEQPPHDASAPRRFRFSLQDLSLAFILICGVLAMLARMRSVTMASWYTSAIPGLILGAFTVASALAVQKIRNRWLRSAAVIVNLPAIFISVWLWLAQATRGRRRLIAYMVAFLLMAWLPAAYFVRELKGRSFAFPLPPAGNSYDELLQAARLLTATSQSIDKLSGAALRSYVSRNRSALDQAQRGLARPCQAVLHDDASDMTLIAEMNQFERLAQLFAALGRLELANGRPGAAANACLAAIRLGAAVSSGGTMAHDMFGARMEQTGVEALQKVVLQLDDAQCRELVQRLVAIDAAREPLEELMEQERFYIKQSYPWKHRVWELVPEAPRQLEPVWEAMSRLKIARLRLLVCHLALRRYQLALGVCPASLEQLVPQYLDELPLDPFSGEPLVYRKQSPGYQLYSVGFDCIDDGGKAAPPFTTTVLPKGDIVVDPAPPPVPSNVGKP